MLFGMQPWSAAFGAMRRPDQAATSLTQSDRVRIIERGQVGLVRRALTHMH